MKVILKNNLKLINCPLKEHFLNIFLVFIDSSYNNYNILKILITYTSPCIEKTTFQKLLSKLCFVKNLALMADVANEFKKLS